MRPSARRLGLAIAASGLLLGLLWALMPAPSRDTPVGVLPAPPPPSTWSPQALATPVQASGTQTLGGQVLGLEGPVAGALVVALPSPSAAWRALSFPSSMDWTETCVQDSVVARFLEQVDTHRQDAVPLARSTTDAQGRFLLEGLGPDPFVLWAEKGVLLGVHEGISAGAHEARVSVRPGAWLSSEVLDNAGAPIAGVRVTTWVHAAGRVVETVTGEDGRFVLGPLPDRQEPLVLSKPGLLTTSRFLLHPARELRLSRPHRLSGRVEDERGPVAGASVRLENLPALDAVTTDARGNFEFEGLCAGRHVLQARQASLTARQWVDVAPGRDGPPVDLLLMPSVRLSGQVTDPSGQVLTEAEVTASGGGEPPQTLSTKTDSRGRYLLEPLTPGRYTVKAQAPHQVPEQLFPRLLDASQELDLVLKRAEPLEGVVVDERDAPVEGVQLQLLRGRRSDPEQPPATSGADGRFLLDALQAGTWRVVTRHPDFPSEEVTLSAPARDVRVVLRRGATLEAQVVDADGRPVEHAEVFLKTAPDNAQPLEGHTAADGKAVFRPLRPRDYIVQACSSEQGQQSSALTLAAEESRTVRLSLPRGRRLTGDVVDAQGRPVTGASLKLSLDPWRSPGGCRASADISSGDAGHFALTLPEGSWTLSVSARDLVLDARASRGVESTGNTQARVRISADESRVHLVLQSPEGRLRGRVVREDGRPVTSFQLDGREVRHAEGRFAVPLFRDRELTLEAPGLAPFRKDMNRVSLGEDVDLGEVVLEPLVRVEGTVVDALSAAPIARTLVGIQGRPLQPARLSAVSYTRPDGHFTLEDVRPTDTSLRIEHPLYPPLDVAFTPGAPVQVRLVPGATLEGRVEAEGVPVAGGTVQLRTPQGALVATTEVRQGRYTLGRLQAGRYMVRVQGLRRADPAVLFPLRTVELAAGERTPLDFSDSRAGVSVEVRVPERGIEVYLIPGEFPLLGPRQGLHGKLLEGLLGKHVSDTARHFPLLSGGLYTLIAIRADENTDVHRELVELPDEGEFSFTLAPIWNHYEE